jgi:DNA-binding NarL/FixJ family response regulator
MIGIMGNNNSNAERRNGLYGQEVRKPDRRRVPVRERSQDIQQLWQRSHEILRYVLLGMDNNTVAKLVGVTPATVSNTINSSLGQKKLSELRVVRDAKTIDVAEEVCKLHEKAVRVYADILEGKGEPSKALQKATADTVIMDISGHRAPTKVDARHLNIQLTPEELEDLKGRGRKAAAASGLLLEESADA